MMLSAMVFLTYLPARAADPWWDDGWPYRVRVQTQGSGIVQASIDFSKLFNSLGLNQALLDLRSLRVVPYSNGVPGDPVPYAESYSTLLEDAENPQIGWSESGVYWRVNEGHAEADHSRFSQGGGSLKATIEFKPGGYGYPGLELLIADSDPRTDWSRYETFIYDVWPEVNASALDQAPDLYWFKLYNACGGSAVTQGGPPLALGQWNHAAVSLHPLDSCWPADGLNLSDISRVEFHTRKNETVNGNGGLWDDGDLLTLWMDNLRLVDQNSGAVRWQTVNGVSDYYIYFDTLFHEGHVLPVLNEKLGPATLSGSVGAAEAGGYYHRIDGASGPEAQQVWAAPTVEKILRPMALPVDSGPVRLSAARGEFEPFQMIVKAPSARSLKVSTSHFTKGSDTLPPPTLHRVDYVNITTAGDHFDRFGLWPDPLWPLNNGDTVDFPANQNQPLWFTVQVPWEAAPGIYNGTVTIGSTIVPVELEVWNFSLPREIHLYSEWGFGWSSLVSMYRGTNGGVQECYWELVDAFKQDFMNHRLTPKGVAWPSGLNWNGGVEFDCENETLDAGDPDDIWEFTYLGGKYIHGEQGFNEGYGFPTFLAFGPSSNWPPDTRPSSFCGEPRGTDPPGGSAYNEKWKAYLSALDDYITDPAHYYADSAYVHLVNEPQTFEDYDIVAYLARLYKAAAPNLKLLLSEQVEESVYNNAKYGPAKIDIWMPTISNYEPEKSHDRQKNHSEEVWWYYLYGDDPPLPNPILMSHPGMEARITPWLAWAERVNGLLHYSSTDWSSNPWETPNVTGRDNGDAFFFYPPRKDGGNLDYCGQNGHRLVPSIRWENLRDGMEDYEYLWLLAEGNPQIEVPNKADPYASRMVHSRTLFSRVPTDLTAARRAMGETLSGTAEPGSLFLSEGWNLISLCRQPSNPAIESVLDTISGKYSSVWAYGNGTWELYDPGPPVSGSLKTMEAGRGYWIQMKEAAILNTSGETTPDPIDLVKGWNLTGFNDCESRPIAEALSLIDGKYGVVWAYIDGAWKLYDPAHPVLSDLETMEPGYGYWIGAEEAGAWILP